MRILITGGAGMLGRDLLELAPDAVALSRAELDIGDARAVNAALARVAPDVVINCAAFTDVDGAEARPDDAMRVNGAGAGNVAAAAAAAGAWTIHISSDYVFDGEKREPYLESDPVAPRSAYGRSKLGGELAVAREAPERHTIVRTSWLFGAHGRCFPATIMKLATERDELSVVDDQVGCPTYTGHLAAALLDLAERPTPGIVHVAAAGQCSWYEFAREIVSTTGLACEIKPVSTGQFPRPAQRPAYSVLRSERGAPELPDWHEGLPAYLAAAKVAA
jgi:dTDP-4-dehydrorhamnose reductase